MKLTVIVWALRWVGLVLVTALTACAHLAIQPQSTSTVTAIAMAVPFAPDVGSVAIHCGTLIDGINTVPLRDVTVTIRLGHIDSIANGAEHTSDLPWLELGSHTCLPGLVDMHTHLTDSPEDTADLAIYYTRTDAQIREISARNAEATLMAGFTTVRNVGTYVAWSDRALRDAINHGSTAGPRMQVVGFYLTIPGGGGDLVVPNVPEKDIPRFTSDGEGVAVVPIVNPGPQLLVIDHRVVPSATPDQANADLFNATLWFSVQPGGG